MKHLRFGIFPVPSLTQRSIHKYPVHPRSIFGYSILGNSVDRSEAFKLARTPVSDNLRYGQKVHTIS
jgi:hypothetical protein